MCREILLTLSGFLALALFAGAFHQTNPINLTLLDLGRYPMPKQQRFSKYTPLLLALPFRQVHTPASITNFAQKNGLLSFLHPHEPEPLARQRVRIALGLFSRNNHFPQEGDAYLETRGQMYRGWFGWRWQRMKSAEEAHEVLNRRVKPLLDALNPGALYRQDDILRIWDDLPLENPPYSYRRGRTDWRRDWLEMNTILIRMSLDHYSRGLNLDPNQAFNSEIWRKGI